MLPELSDVEALRYNRQITLRGFDFDGQEKLKAAKSTYRWVRWPRLCSGAISGCRRCRAPHPARFRYRSPFQSTASDTASR